MLFSYSANSRKCVIKLSVSVSSEICHYVLVQLDNRIGFI